MKKVFLKFLFLLLLWWNSLIGMCFMSGKIFNDELAIGVIYFIISFIGLMFPGWAYEENK